MPFRPSATDRRGREPAGRGTAAGETAGRKTAGRKAAGSDQPVPLASAKYLLLTSFNRDGASQATPVRVLADGDRAYFRTSDASGISKRLQHTDWVQVAPCTVLGICRTGPTVDATARLLADDEASRAAEQLAPLYPAWRGFLSSVAHRITGRQAVYYELQPDEAAEEPAVPPTVTSQPLKRVSVRLMP